MSNKTLGIAVAVIVLLAGAFVWYRLSANDQTRELGYSENGATREEPVQNGSEKPAQEQTPDEVLNPNQTNNQQTMNNCQRNFDAQKLAADKVDIKNRAVEINVSGFGKIQVELYDQDAPKTVENFLRLVNAGYYDCVTFHRVAKGFVVQAGDPTGTGGGGESAFGGEFADELDPATPSAKEGYKKGVLAMANRGPNTNTSQFFIMLGDVDLPHNYTIFGKVTAGLEAVDKIGQVEIIPQLGPTDGAPKEKVVMEKVTIIK